MIAAGDRSPSAPGVQRGWGGGTRPPGSVRTESLRGAGEERRGRGAGRGTGRSVCGPGRGAALRGVGASRQGDRDGAVLGVNDGGAATLHPTYCGVRVRVREPQPAATNAGCWLAGCAGTQKTVANKCTRRTVSAAKPQNHLLETKRKHHQKANGNQWEDPAGRTVPSGHPQWAGAPAQPASPQPGWRAPGSTCRGAHARGRGHARERTQASQRRAATGLGRVHTGQCRLGAAGQTPGPGLPSRGPQRTPGAAGTVWRGLGPACGQERVCGGPGGDPTLILPVPQQPWQCEPQASTVTVPPRSPERSHRPPRQAVFVGTRPLCSALSRPLLQASGPRGAAPSPPTMK